MKQLQVLVSMGCFFKWLRHEGSTLRLGEHLNLLLEHGPAEVVGLELSIGWEEIPVWLKALRNQPCLPPRSAGLSEALQSKILKLSHNSLHLPAPKLLPIGRERWFAESINEIADRTGISEFTVHPDQTRVDSWKRILKYVRTDLSISVENMDREAKNYKTLQELEALLKACPQLNWTFDVAHWLGQGLCMSEKQLLMKLSCNRLSKVHYSAPDSKYASMSQQETRGHLPLHESGYLLPELFFSSLNRPFVLEGAVDIHEFELIYHEINTLRYFHSTKRSVAA